MSNKKKLLLFVICSVAVAVINLLLAGFIIFLALPAVLYALFYEKFDFCRSRFASMFFHWMIWLGLIELCMLFVYRFNDPIEKENGMLKLEEALLIGLCYWAILFFISLVIIAIKNGLRKRREKAENEQMMREIMQRNTESNFKEKNDV